MNCNKLLVVFRIIVLILLSVIAFNTFIINAKLDIFFKAVGLRADAKPTQDFLISEKYDNGVGLVKALESKKPVVVWFYVDWCGYCKKFADTFDKLSKDSVLKEKFEFAFVNCEEPENKALLEEYKVQAFPSVFVINKGKSEFIDNSLLFGNNAVKNLKKMFLDLIK